MNMEKLMKPAEYAKELGISRQAVYAKIKRGILTAKNVEGKLYIVVDKDLAQETTPNEKETTVTTKRATSPKANISVPATDTKDYKALLKAKDETISVLKGTVKDLKKSNKQISTTLKGEIDLIKEAFYEMRTLYVHQLEQKKSQEAIEIISEEESVDVEEDRWIGLKKFFKQHKITKEKEKTKITKRLKKAYRSGDERIMGMEDKLKFNANKSYKDLLK
jgi:predicted site-specific integrase-resolvase